MTDVAPLTWASPSFPIGAFAWSGGLEAAVARGAVDGEAALAEWLGASLLGGTIRTDALFVALAAGADNPSELDVLAVALAGSPARERELRALGTAFARATTAWRGGAPLPAAYPVAFGTLARAHAINAEKAALLFAHGAILNTVAAAQRLLPLGQAAAMRVMAGAEPALLRLADGAARATIEDIGSATPLADLCALAHPALEPRLFRS